MEEISCVHLHDRLHNKKRRYPFNGHIELTYRCNLNCIYCYCKGSENKDRELTTCQWKHLLDVIQAEGCVYLTFTGGDPLIREDFLELYSYAKKKCFVVTILTNGQALSGKIIDYLAKSPPYLIEITLNGITKNTYEAITKTRGSFSVAMENIKKVKEKKLSLTIKSNCLKQNKNEIVQIKAFTDKFLGKEKRGYHFKYDTMIYPRLDRDKTPANFRLSFGELLELKRRDADIWREYKNGLNADFPDLGRDRSFLYRCTAWKEQFFINPYGRLKFCNFSEKFGVDLNTSTFREGFYKTFSKLLNKKFRTDSKCKDCRLRSICHNCPARAYLETGDEEAAVEYYCQLAKKTEKQKELSVCSK